MLERAREREREQEQEQEQEPEPERERERLETSLSVWGGRSWNLCNALSARARHAYDDLDRADTNQAIVFVLIQQFWLKTFRAILEHKGMPVPFLYNMAETKCPRLHVAKLLAVPC